jgi:hypothetical protein
VFWSLRAFFDHLSNEQHLLPDNNALNFLINFILFFFFACPKEKESKRKGSRSLAVSLLSAFGGCPEFMPLYGCCSAA